MADAIFISYRRDDSEGEAGRLFDDLTRADGRGGVRDAEEGTDVALLLACKRAQFRADFKGTSGLGLGDTRCSDESG